MRTSLFLLTVLFLLAVALVGCDSFSSSNDLRLFTDVNAYTPRASVTITLANEGTTAIDTHPELCGLLPQMRVSSGWVTASPYDRIDFACTAIVGTLPPGERISVAFPLTNLDEPGGTYRFTYGTAAGLLTSNRFQVQD